MTIQMHFVTSFKEKSKEIFIKLKSRDGLILKIRLEAAKRSTVIADLLDMLAPDFKEDEVEIPLMNVEGSVLKKIVLFLESRVPPKIILPGAITLTAKELVDVPLKDLYPVYEAANYLAIQDLMDLCAMEIVAKIKGKSVAELRNILQLENDFTPMEEEGIADEYPWCQ